MSSQLAGALARPVYITYIAHYTGGGSAVSLRTLLQALDRSQFVPALIVHRVKDPVLVTGLEELGIPVTSLVAPRSEASAARESRISLAGRLGQAGSQTWLRDVYRSMRAVRDASVTDVRWLPGLVRLLQGQRPDLIHCNNGLTRHRLDLLVCAKFGIPAVCHVRDFETLTGLERLAARSTRRFIYVSQAVADCYTRQGVPAEQGVVIPNAVTLEAIEPPDPGQRAEFGWGCEHFVAANVGRLVPWKGQDVFLRAVACLMPRIPHLRALVIGGADDNPSSRVFADDLYRLSHSLGIEDRVVFTGHRRDATRLMGMADVVVHTATKPEPFGRVVIEAMATGRPIVATQAGGVLDVVQHEKTGLLVPPQDVAALAEALERLVTSPVWAARLGEHGRQYVATQFTAAQHAAQVMDVYRQCLPVAGVLCAS